MGTPLKKVLQDFKGQKLRTTIVIVSITVGVFAISGIGTMSATITKAFTDVFNKANNPDITIVTSPATGRPLEGELGALPNVSASEARTFYQTRLRIAGSWHAANLIGIRSFSQMRVNKIPIKDGTYPHGGQIALDYTSRQMVSVSVGEGIQVQGKQGVQGYRLTGYAVDASVLPAQLSGVLEGFLPEGDALRLSGMPSPNEFLLTMKTFDQKDATVSAVRRVLKRRHLQALQFVVRDPHHFAVLDTFKTLTTLLTIFGVVSLVLSSMLVINTMNTIVSEQTPQIGTMKAVGASAGQIARSYLTLGFLYGFFGTILGLVLGVVGAYLLIQAFAGQNGLTVSGVVISSISVFEGVLVGIGVALVGALLPVWTGSRVSVREAIASYGIGMGYKSTRLDEVIGALRFLSRPARMSVRNTFRRRGRLALTLIPLSLAGALFVAVGSLTGSLHNAVDEVASVNRGDLVVQLAQPGAVGRVKHVASTVTGVTALETWYQVPVTISGQTNVPLFGVPEATRAYRIVLRSGRWVSGSDTGSLVAGDSFARDNHLRLGQVLSVRTPSGNVGRWRLVGTVNDLNNSGTLAFAPQAQVERLVQQSGMTNYLLVTTTRHTDSAVGSVGDRLGNALFPLGVQPRITRVSDLTAAVRQQFTIFTVLFYVIVALVSVVGALGLFAVLSMNVVERRKEIGVMRSIGASSMAVIQVFGVEGLAVGLISFLLALLVSVPATIGFTFFISRVLIQISFLMSPVYVILMLFFILFIAAISSIVPAASAARLRIADVLRYG